MSSSTVPAGAPPLPTVGPRDFPTWLPPMLVKELRQGLRTRGFVSTLVGFQLVLVFMMLGALVSGSALQGTARAAAFTGVNTFFWVLVTVHLLVATPLRALGALRAELDARLLDLLILTRLSAWRIVLGKWSSLTIQAVLLLITMLPYAVVRYFGGSVDLVADANRCAGLLAGSAVLTALAIWASSLARAMQILVPVLAFVTMQFGSVLMRGSGPFGPVLRIPSEVWVLNGTVALWFFLVAAVRRIAPAAENHAPLGRLLMLVPLLAVPVIRLTMSSPLAARAQFVFAVIFVAVVAAVEFSNFRRPMSVHWEPWMRRGALARLFGRLLLPGWSSAYLLTLTAGALASVIAVTPHLFPSGEVADMVWRCLLGLAGIVFPVVVISFLPRLVARSPGGYYLLVFAILSALAVIVSINAENTWLDTVAQVLPVSGFWVSLSARGPAVAVLVPQCLVAFAVLILGYVQAGRHWVPVSQLQARAEREAQRRAAVA